MKFLRKQLDSLEPLFEKGGKLEKFYPLFEAADSFLFSPKTVTKVGAHIRDAIDTKRYMIMVVVALIPCTFFGIFNTGYQAHLAAGESLSLLPVIITGLKYVLPLILVSYTVGGLIEGAFALVRRHEINEGFLVSGLLFPLTCPPDLPLWMVAMGIIFGVVVGKEVFGGTGRNFLNPALTARAFVFFAYPGQISGDVWVGLREAKEKMVSGFSGATPLSVIGQSAAGTSPTQDLIEAGYTFKNMVIGLMPGSVGETSLICVLIGAFILIVTGIGSWRIMLGSLIGLLTMTTIFNMFASETTVAFFNLPAHWHMAMGSFAFATVFMATDPVSAPDLNESKWIYGILIGMMGVIIRCINPAYPEGWMLSILLLNVFAPLIDHYMIQRRLKKRIPNVI